MEERSKRREQKNAAENTLRDCEKALDSAVDRIRNKVCKFYLCDMIFGVADYVCCIIWVYNIGNIGRTGGNGAH